MAARPIPNIILGEGMNPVRKHDPVVRVDKKGLQRLLSLAIVPFVPKEAASYIKPGPAQEFHPGPSEIGFLQTEEGPLRVVVEVTGEDD
jgi:hypothetical protein